VTDPGNLKAFGTKERPVILDISQLIERVNWVLGKNFLVLRINAKMRKGHTPTASVIVSDGAYTGEVFTTTINEHDDNVPFPAISLPKISKAMFAHTIEFNKSPPLKKADETFNDYTQLIFLNLRRLKSFRDFKDDNYQIKISFPAGVHRRSPTTLYYAFFNFGTLDWELAKAFPLHAIPFFYTVKERDDNTPHIGSNIQLLNDAADRALFLTLNPEWGSHDEPDFEIISDAFQWEVEGWTFKGRDEFPVNLVNYTFSFDTNDSKTKGHGKITTPPIAAAATVTIRVNFKTLSLELTKA
jgi:hypothetical protein